MRDFAWSEHTDELCPKCSRPTGLFPESYPFVAIETIQCPWCGAELVNAYDSDIGFHWTDDEYAW